MSELSIQEILQLEAERQEAQLTLIPSENYPSLAVRSALSSLFSGKYAEGYPGKRYYAGNGVADLLELRVQDLARQAFSTDYHVNVQPHAGSPANLAVYRALLQPGDTVMGMRLDQGGHLTHGHKVSATGSLWNFVQYGLDENEQLDMQQVATLAHEHKPKLIVCGATAYSQQISFQAFADIARQVGALLMADISHISGLVSTGLHPSPFGLADVVTSTTHKLLRGPRGAIIWCKPEHAAAIDKSVFPGLQGGPHLNNIAGIGIALQEALQPSYRAYTEQVVATAHTLAQTLQEKGLRIVSGGTQTHQFLVDLRTHSMLGREAQDRLEAVGLVTNRNALPHDPNPPSKPSGLRLGTPAIATRGMGIQEAQQLAGLISECIGGATDLTPIADQVRTLAARFPIPH